MDYSLPRRRKSAAERRAQCQRSEGRLLQHALSSLNDVHAHRGGSLTRFGQAMRIALISMGPHCDGVPASDVLDGALPFYKVRFPKGHLCCGEPSEFVEQVAPELVSLSSPRREGEDVVQESVCGGDSACFSDLRSAEADAAACEAECQRLIVETRSKISLLQQSQDKLAELRYLLVPMSPTPHRVGDAVTESFGDIADCPEQGQHHGRSPGVRGGSVLLPERLAVLTAHIDTLADGILDDYLLESALRLPCSFSLNQVPVTDFISTNEEATSGMIPVDSVRTTNINMALGCSTLSSERASLRSDHVHDANGGVKYDCAQQ